MHLQKFAEISDVVARVNVSIKNRLELIQKDLDTMRDHEAEFKLIAEALAGVRTSWQVPEPKPRGWTQWFFVRSFTLHEPYGYPRVEHCERFWIKELLDDPETAEKILQPNLLGTHEEIAKGVCAKFGKPNPNALIMGRNERTLKSPFGEEWELHLYTLCLSCPALTLICRHVDNTPFPFA